MATMQDNLKAFMEAGARYYACPTGTMLPFGGTTVPTGFLLCNGAAVSRTTYAKLFAAIGTKWGTGDGSTTFNLPNCNDRCLEGTTSTSNVGKYLEAGLPDISSINTSYGQFCGWTGGSGSGTIGAISYSNSGYSPDGGSYGRFIMLDLRASRSNSKFGSSSTIQPLAFQTLMIIKV